MSTFILPALGKHCPHISSSATQLQQENPHYQSHKTNVYMGIEKANQAGHTLVKHLLFCSKSELLDLMLVGTGYSCVIFMAIRIMFIIPDGIKISCPLTILQIIIESNDKSRESFMVMYVKE